jgi:hypothetical protein
MLSDLSFFLSIIVKVAAIVVGVVYWKWLPLPYRIIMAQVFVGILAETAGKIMNMLHYPSNQWVFNIYMLAETLLIGSAAYFFMKEGRARRLAKYLLLSFIVCWPLCLYAYTVFHFFSAYYVSYSFFLILLYTYVLTNYALFTKKKLLGNPLFIICISVIMMFAGTIPFFGTLKHVVENDIDVALLLFYVIITINLIRYLLVTIAFYLCGSQAKGGYVRQ